MTQHVVTVTLNPAIDQTITVEALKPGSVHRAKSVLYNAGGKGVNVASCLADWGTPVIAAGLLGSGNAAPFEALFAAKGITAATAAEAAALARASARPITDVRGSDEYRLELVAALSEQALLTLGEGGRI